MLPPIACFITVFLSGVLFSRGFHSFPTKSHHQHRAGILLLAAQDKKDRGYKFGDITKGLLNKATSKINDVTGKEEYQFGDLSRHLDSKVKQRINTVTGKDEYQFGDLSRHLDEQAKRKVTNYTGKEDYQVGDISKEILRRIGTGEYALADVILLCKVLLTFGVGLTPVASSLPAKLLIEILEFGLAQEVGEKLMGAVATVLDERFKEAITGDKNYRIGDKTRQAVEKLIAMATTEQNIDATKTTTKVIDAEVEMDSALIAELEDWDRRLGISTSDTGKSTGGSSASTKR